MWVELHGGSYVAHLSGQGSQDIISYHSVLTLLSPWSVTMPPGSNIQDFSKTPQNVLKLDINKDGEKEMSKTSKYGDLVSQYRGPS